MARERAEEAEAKIMMQFQLARAECERVKVELEEKQRLLAEQAEILSSNTYVYTYIDIHIVVLNIE